MRREESFFNMQTTNNLRKTLRRRLIRVSHQSLICSFALLPLCGIVGIALLSESVIAIPSSTRLQIAQQPVSTEPDAIRTAAKTAFDEGMRLYQQGDKASLQQAIVKWKEAVKLFRVVRERGGEAVTLVGIGRVYSNLGEQQQALIYYNQALPLLRAVGDRGGEATTLTNIGGVYSALGQKQQALTYYNQALPLFRAVPDQRGEAGTLTNIGNVYSYLGEQQQALTYHNQALPLFRAVRDRGGEASTLNNIGLVYSDLGQKQQALTYYNQALPLFRAVPDQRGEAATLSNIGNVYSDLGQKQQALIYLNQALPLLREVGDPGGEATTLNNIGSVYRDLGEKQQALTYYKQALPLRRAVGDPGGEATILNNMGAVYKDLGESSEALKYYKQALPLRRAVRDRGGEATTLTNIGSVHRDLGEQQKALTYYNQALLLRRAVGDPGGEASTLNNIGRVYSDLGDQEQALTYYNQALPLHRAVRDRGGEATTLTNIGSVCKDLGKQEQEVPKQEQEVPKQEQALTNIESVCKDLGKQEQEVPKQEQARKQALKYYNQALPLYRAVRDPGGEAVTLNNIGAVYSDLGKQEQARTYYNQALPLYRAVGDRDGEASTLNNIGFVYSDLGDQEQARTYYNQALPLKRAVGDRGGEAATLGNIAKVERQQGNLAAALTRIDEAIKIVEDLRTKITSPELRTSYFATQQGIYQLKINLLMELHKQNPSKGYDIQALETTDRSRARSLVELLTESKADIRVGIEPKLLAKERDLNGRRDALEREKQKLASIKDSDAAIANLNQQIDKLIKEQEELRTDIRIASPNYAALKFPTPLTLPQIQQKVLDDDTLLLTYSLGADRSYLWLMSKTEIQSYELPKRSVIEAQAKQFYKQQKTKPSAIAKNPQTGAQLSQTLLQPVANKLGNKRLLIVADGALQYIPFAALTLCKDGTCNESSRLVTNHEIVNAPSISTIDIIRTSKRQTPTKTLAVIADPVFGADDPRFLAKVREAKLPPKDSSKILASQQLERSAKESGIMKFDRLKGTRDEAESILPLVPSNMQLTKFDFDANREFVTTSPELGKYRHILFATHGILNSKQPELSGLVLSRIDKKGQSLNGFLQLNDIFNLQLSADLVVLSACETGLGQQISGEGSIGLTRGFMYAGSPRVVVSLWKVSDDGTAELMKKFYTNILQKKLTPAAALRAAQLAMSQDKKYSDPYYWAGFTLQGEWK
jgi:CHAT domain-containing protein/Tfp pilus assembly protein PilF